MLRGHTVDVDGRRRGGRGVAVRPLDVPHADARARPRSRHAARDPHSAAARRALRAAEADAAAQGRGAAAELRRRPLDDSRSMQVADQNGKPRATSSKDQFGRTDGPLLTALGKRFNVRAVPLLDVGRAAAVHRATSRFKGTGTRLGDALDRARDELSGLPVAGLVMVTDGADNAETTIDESIAGLKAQAMPVFAVGVGKDRLTRDVQVTRAETPRRVLKGASLVVDVVVTQVGYAGAEGAAHRRRRGPHRQLAGHHAAGRRRSRETVHVRFKAADVGPRLFRFRVPVQAERGSAAEQPARRADRRLQPAREDSVPRRRAAARAEVHPAGDRRGRQPADRRCCSARRRPTSNAPDKYLRLGVDDPRGAAERLPDDARGAVRVSRRSSSAASRRRAFTPEQQRMLEDFVDVRGGGLLALGGDASFGEGGWAGTPLADALPVVLDRAASQQRHAVSAVGAHRAADARRRESPGDADHRQGSGRGGEVARPAAAHVAQPHPRRQSRARRCS